MAGKFKTAMSETFKETQSDRKVTVNEGFSIFAAKINVSEIGAKI
jgi:hypothetical protein